MGDTPSRPSGRPDYINTSPYPRQGSNHEPFMHQINYSSEMGRSVHSIKPAYAKISDNKIETEKATVDRFPPK
jgi:hypothetical protein